MCILEHYWYKMSDRGMVTYNVSLVVLSAWHCYNSEVDTKRTVRWIQRLSKRRKLTDNGYKNSKKVKNSDFVEPWHSDSYKYCLISKLLLMLLSFKIVYKTKTKTSVSIFSEKMNKYFNVTLNQKLKYRFSH